MKKLTKIIVAALAGSLIVSSLTSCGKKKEEKGSVRFLNFKPEVAAIYQELAAAYEKEKGVKVIVETAANNSYESTLTSKMATKQAPTLFQINGPVGYGNWKNYCADLTDTEIYKQLSDKSLAVTSNGRVYGIPYVVEGYGIIYNKAITDKYFALPSKASKLSSMDEVKNFAALKEVVEDMQKNAAALGIKGVFASTSLKAGEDWRWQTHLANLPVYYEFKRKNADLSDPEASKKLDFEYDAEFKNIFDLYLNNSVIPPQNAGVKTVDNSMAEFALEECAMVQNGNWAWGQISGVSGNKVKSINVKYLPIYTGVSGEEGQGLCIGTENFYCINKKASPADQKATADFIYWLYSSVTGKDYVTNKLGFIAPFDTFAAKERPTDPLAIEIANWMEKPGITSVSWNFTVFPSQTFKDNFGASLLRYAQGSKKWAAVKADVVKDWASEKALAE